MARRKATRGQVSAAAIVLIVFAIILILIAIFAIIYFNGFSAFGLSGKTVEKENGEIKDYNNYPQEAYCPVPYIKVGMSCCLDKNFNSICDNDEAQKENEINTCYAPYIKDGTSCCLDDDDNGRCDRTEEERVERGDLDSPFSLRDVAFFRNYIELDIKNKGDEDLIITNIDISGCDEDDFDETIESGETETFELDCDDGRDSRRRDVDIEYKIVGGDETLSSDGYVEYRDYVDEEYYWISLSQIL